MSEQLDYIFFFYGFGFIVLAAACFLANNKKSSLPWTWLGLFGLIHGLNEWLDMINLSMVDSPIFKTMRLSVMVLSFICLVEFGRLGTKSILGKGPGKSITLLLFAVGCMGWMYGWAGLNVFFRYSLCFIGGIWSALAIYLARRHAKTVSDRNSLLSLVILLVTYSVSSGLIVPKASFLPAVLINHDSFLQMFGFPVQLLRGTLALASAICVWHLLDSHRTEQVYRTAFASFLLVILGTGWYFTDRSGIYESQKWQQRLLSTCTISAASIDPEHVKDIDSIEDLKTLNYKQLKKSLMKMQQASPDFRFIYLMVVRDGKVIFSADSEPQGSRDYSAPGDEYTDAPPELRALSSGHGRSTIAEYKDVWGKWISAFVPIRDDQTGELVAIFGIDYPQSIVHQAVYLHRLYAIVFTLLIACIAILLFYFRERREWFIENISEANNSLQRKEEHLSCTLNSIGDAVIATDCDGRINRMNRVAEILTGWKAADAQNHPVSEVFHIINASTGEPAFNPIGQVLASGESAELDEGTIITSIDGQQRHIADSCAPVLDNEGHTIGAVLVFRDITENYLQHMQLCESERVQRELIDSIDVGVLVVDPETHIIERANHSAAKMFAAPGNQIIGTVCPSLSYPDESNCSPIPDHHQEVEQVDGMMVRADGTQIPVMKSVRLIQIDSRHKLVETFVDITKRKQAEKALQNEKDNLAAVFASSPVGMLLLDEDTVIVEANGVIANMVSGNIGDIINKRAGGGLGCIHSHENPNGCGFALACADCPLRQSVTQVLKTGTSIRGTELQTSLLLDGKVELLWLRISAEPVMINGRKHVIVAMDNITERKQSEEKLADRERRYRMLWESASDGFCLHELIRNAEGTVVNYRILEVNPAYEGILGIKASDVIGKLATDVYGTTKPPFLDIYARVASTGVSEHFETNYRRMGRHFSISVFSPSPGQFATAFADISERKTHEDVLTYQATHDMLTGLPNRHFFEQHLDGLIKSNSGKIPSLMAVLFLDLDKFKLINDTLGHKVGDLLLTEVAGRLQACLRSQDILARMGGDEFTVILTGNVCRATVESVASRVIDSISSPFEIQGHKFVIGGSVGLSSYPSDGTDTVTLLKHADAAMYKAKQSGRGRFCWYSGDVDVENQQRADMEMDIRAALEEGQFSVHYQPIMSLDDGSILSAEALLRWEHPEKGMISPSLFIPIAEEIGMIGSIGEYVLRTACAQTMAWRDEGIFLSQIGVNVSTAQVHDAGWLDAVRTIISETGLEAQYLNLELTETDFASDYESMKETLRKVQDLGICIAIDDFGIGHSSLSRLKDFPVIHLKIDGSFVRDIGHRDIDNTLLRSIIEMAHAQGIKVTAEWVETDSQVEILRSIGCDFAQGYFISPALSSKDFRDFVKQWTFAGKAAAAGWLSTVPVR